MKIQIPKIEETDKAILVQGSCVWYAALLYRKFLEYGIRGRFLVEFNMGHVSHVGLQLWDDKFVDAYGIHEFVYDPMYMDINLRLDELKTLLRTYRFRAGMKFRSWDKKANVKKLIQSALK